MKDFIEWLKSDLAPFVVFCILFSGVSVAFLMIPMFFSKTRPVITILGIWLSLTITIGGGFGIVLGSKMVLDFLTLRKKIITFWGSDFSGLQEINKNIHRSVNGMRQVRFTELKLEEDKPAIMSSVSAKPLSFKNRLYNWMIVIDTFMSSSKQSSFSKGHIEELDPITKLVTVGYIQKPGDIDSSFFLRFIGTTGELQWVAEIISDTTTLQNPWFFWGNHPHLANKKEPPPTPLPNPQILLIEPSPDGVYLFRLTAEGEYAGDTWHQSEAEARNQAAYEYGDHLGSWREVPQDVRGIEAIIAFATATSGNGEE